MALVCVEALDENAQARARELATALHVPMAGGASDATTLQGVKLMVSTSGLALAFMDKKRGKPFYVDFLSASWKARFQQPLGKNHIFRRALGWREEPLHVLDATAGFGQDSVLALSLGCQVTAIERSPVVSALLCDGIERAAREDDVLRMRFKKLKVLQADAVDYMKSLKADVIYIDPMFEKPKKSAKSPKEMQLLQELLTSVAGEETRLLEAALASPISRVVIKRPLKARAGKTPSHSFKGQSIRYDVYVKPVIRKT